RRATRAGAPEESRRLLRRGSPDRHRSGPRARVPDGPIADGGRTDDQSRSRSPESDAPRCGPEVPERLPIAGMRRLRAIPPQRRLMTAAEEQQLLAVGDAQDRAILILGRDTLVRLGDLLDLQRRDRRGPWLYIADPKA